MDENNLISKKELLQLTGISYGQLYRWKRENLIPEAWFIKKSSFTGQETFFPKDKILKRTAMILELKDKYSLEELGNIFSPENTNKMFRQDDIGEISEIKPEIAEIFAKVFEKDRFSFMELIFMYIVSRLKNEVVINDTETLTIVYSIKNWVQQLKDTAYNFLVIKKENEIITLLLKQEAVYYLDSKSKILKIILLDEAAKELNEIVSGK